MEWTKHIGSLRTTWRIRLVVAKDFCPGHNSGARILFSELQSSHLSLSLPLLRSEGKVTCLVGKLLSFYKMNLELTGRTMSCSSQHCIQCPLRRVTLSSMGPNPFRTTETLDLALHLSICLSRDLAKSPHQGVTIYLSVAILADLAGLSQRKVLRKDWRAFFKCRVL